MAENTKIWQIQVPDANGVLQTYDIRDNEAIHDIADLGLGNALVFKGVKETYAQLPTTGNKVGDVWLVRTDEAGEEREYVWTSENEWELLGAPHDFASSDHTHDLTTAETEEVLGTGTVFTAVNSLTEIGLTATAEGVAVAPDGTGKALAGVTVTDNTTGVVTGATKTEDGATKITNYGTQAAWYGSVNSGVLSFSWTTNALATGQDVDVVTDYTTGTAVGSTTVNTTESADFLTGVKVTTQPTVTLNTNEKGTGINVVTGVTTTVTAGAEDKVSVPVSFTVSGPKDN